MNRTAVALLAVSVLFVGYVAGGYRSSVANAEPAYAPVGGNAGSYLTNSPEGNALYAWSVADGKVTGVTRYEAWTLMSSDGKEVRSFRVIPYTPASPPPK